MKSIRSGYGQLKITLEADEVTFVNKEFIVYSPVAEFIDTHSMIVRGLLIESESRHTLFEARIFVDSTPSKEIV